MRGADGLQESLFTVAKLDDFVPADHPLRSIRTLVNEALGRLNSLFNMIYADRGRDSIAPEKLMRALLLQVFYSSARSGNEEQCATTSCSAGSLGCRWKIRSGNHSVFSKNRIAVRERGIESFFTEVMRQPTGKPALEGTFLCRRHVDPGLGQPESFRPKTDRMIRRRTAGAQCASDWKGKPPSNDTHASTTDRRPAVPEEQQYGLDPFLPGHVLMENRSGLVVSAVVTHADGPAKASGDRMLDGVPGTHSKTVGADKAYDTADFIAACRQRNVTPHVAQNEGRRGGSAIDGRTTRHDGYRISQVIRKRIEEHFGWGKTVGRIRQTVFRGLRRVDQQFKLTMTASNLTRMARILFTVPLGVRQ
jgi:IS5 family transposase